MINSPELRVWIGARMNKRQFAERVVKTAVAILLMAPVTAAAIGTETSNGCSGTQDDPCVRSGSCAIQGASWTQDVTIDRADRFDTQGWPGVCDMVHVGFVQGNCEPAGAQIDVTVYLSPLSFASIPEVVGPLECAGEPQPVPASGAIGRFLLGGLLLLAALGRTRRFSA